ncbi:sodium/potassium-transporting ATPase subunit beta-like [Penaeus chinensis]|uniref:sodium/potassium-transporting ATPase subunit beta-like n=1 Tax=Penaeus chinensis TaxID=139456 RepID=UPI001FB6D5A4|nr:sodium/potassium-transporting ATPase subunit beta-like [Penaeus chinensis]XP_047477811.1 sodium/potassium-transporting ATPase subunit beta-like [Penaeus chinensis]XP_047477813.1 sodium/potassium-transporting ATPase subunit beta-like [Penaeus chinensis]XP_047477814.1 sodium/potassium-transporting ATPase subunit beta-like [Penaeus chinensis]XP_047477815.1 sodium/potassium-transporting ATPase subunit beta-like [Penaeus chinensis]XP_047477816.1 sodium/potassium-transporting ATPase subunit beta-
MALNTFYKVLVGVVVTVVVILAIAVPVALLCCGDADRQTPGLNAVPGGNILIKEGDPESGKAYIEKITSFLKPYMEMSKKTEVINCNSTVRPQGNQVCDYPESFLSHCGRSTNFGFNRSTPCVLLTLTMDESFRPTPYENLHELPKDIPRDLLADMEEDLENGKLRKGIWVDCNNDYLYSPKPLFPDYYYDNVDAEGYLPPIVAVMFKLTSKKNQDIRVECRLWAKDIDSTDQRSKVSFTLRLDGE